MQMTLAQFHGFLAAVGRDETRRFADACATVRIGMADEKSYRKVMEKLETD
ncbi:hypothetical protein [Thiobacillus denitrificans]|uniref:hypothetical protein n=1 Tax=Thiobacillus denitrificans TaxID=36861 RepID=UPI000AD57A5B|nr:hypothetical protein [Thiobacillus denitrificans]